MKKLQITTKSSPKDIEYPIYIGNNILPDLNQLVQFEKYSKVVILTDTNLEKLWLELVQHFMPVQTSIILIPPGETEKNIVNVQKIWKQLLDFGCDRKSLLINLGGGVIGDMGGFAASTYMRGIDSLNMPTTLLAQVDASVGGKTGIDFAKIKNIIGTFEQPTAVIIDTQMLETLPDREFIEGFAEVIKHGLIKDKDYFELVTSKNPREFTAEELADLVEVSCRIKAEIVESDERETGKRKLLNFGHTVGHAIEAAALETDNPFLHGEAISIGMVAEAKISQLLNNISSGDLELIKQSLEKTGLPVSMNFPEKTLSEKMSADKKTSFGKIKWTLLKQIGMGIYDVEVSEKIVNDAINSIKNN